MGFIEILLHVALMLSAFWLAVLIKDRAARKLVALAWRWRKDSKECQCEIVRLNLEAQRWKGASISMGVWNRDAEKINEELKKQIERLELELAKHKIPNGMDRE
jgi:hypothetical protein